MISRPVPRRAAFLLCACSLLVVGGFGRSAGDEPGSKQEPAAKREPAAKAPPLDPLSPEAEKAAQDLQQRLPAGSEARLMLDEILKGKRLGPNDGWFRTAVAQTRFTWKDLAKRYDANHDGKITPEEVQAWDNKIKGKK